MKFDAVDVVIPVNVAGIQDVLERVKALPELFHTLEVHSDTGVACLSQPFRGIESDDDFDFDILVGHFGKDSIAYLVLAFDDDFKRMTAVDVAVKGRGIEIDFNKFFSIIKGNAVGRDPFSNFL